jgi:hypothetical protein
VEAYHGVMEAHNCAMEAHPGAPEAHHGVIGAHWNWSRYLNIEKDHGSGGSGSYCGKMIQLRLFRFRSGSSSAILPQTASISIDFFSQIPLSQKMTLFQAPLP